MVAKELKSLIGPIMTFDLEDRHPLKMPSNDALKIQLKIVTTEV